jgi:hypothetical protein
MASRSTLSVLLLLSTLSTAACSDAMDEAADPGAGGEYLEGEEYDAINPFAELEQGGKADGGYVIPDVDALENPEIIVSLDKFTVHLFDRTSGFSEVYPAGVGILSSNGTSITPTGHFKTSSNTSDSWYYTEKRWSPAYYDGKPFLRINALNSAGQHTYGLHGPIDPQLNRGYVSHGCIRMRAQDIINLFWRVRLHPSTPVTFQDEPEIDAAGNQVDVGMTPVLWQVGEEIEYGASAG